MIFAGRYLTTVDRFGRIILPKEIRAVLPGGGGELYLRQGDGYFIATTEGHLMEFLDDVAPGSASDERVREIRRELLSAVIIIHLDPQGRMKVPVLIDTKENDELALIGTGRDFEIWVKTRLLQRYPEWVDWE